MAPSQLVCPVELLAVSSVVLRYRAIPEGDGAGKFFGQFGRPNDTITDFRSFVRYIPIVDVDCILRVAAASAFALESVA